VAFFGFYLLFFLIGFLLFLLSLFLFFERGEHATIAWKYSVIQAEHHHHHTVLVTQFLLTL
jgi:hypothetical protein